MGKVYCFYHAVDLDGQCSGAIVKYYFKKMAEELVEMIDRDGLDFRKIMPDIELIPFNYHYKIPYEKLTKEDVVYFVDVVPSPYEELLKLQEHVEKVIVFDHHQTFITSEVGEIFREDEESHLQIGIAGCEITWKKLFPDRPMPRCVHLLGKYDSWRNNNKEEWDTVILPFQYGMRLEKTDPVENFEFWYAWLNSKFQGASITDVIEKGNIVLKYQAQQDERTLHQSFDYTLKLNGSSYNCLCANTGSRNSQTFITKWDTGKYDFMIAYSQLKSGKWSFSAYTDKQDRDASVIAKSFGGGGHVGAAGFTVEELRQFFKMDLGHVNLLDEEEQGEVTSYLRKTSNKELIGCLTRFKDMPTCFELTLKEFESRFSNGD
jgi:oligoribonuclease NrnB/cAMP/cGMP phosphodiesterase (DHH superfamily)